MSENSVEITVIGSARGVERELVEADDGRYTAGVTNKEFEDGSMLVYEGNIIQKDLFSGETVQFSLRFTSGVAAGLIANYLYDRLTDYEISLKIGNEEVELDEEEIQSKLEDFE